MKTYGEIENKFRFVIIASKRAKQLLRGTKPKVTTKSKNPIRVAQVEVRNGLVDYEIIEPKKEEVAKPEEEGFIGEEIKTEVEEAAEEVADKAKAKAAKSKDKPKKKAAKRKAAKKKAEEEPKKERKKTKI